MSDPTVSNRIRRLRFDHDEMTQAQLAGLTGVTRQTIIALEGNKYIPSLGLAFRLARVFGVTVEDVFQLEVPGGGNRSREYGSQEQDARTSAGAGAPGGGS
jgi:putative transcriptional regulator